MNKENTVFKKFAAEHLNTSDSVIGRYIKRKSKKLLFNR